MKGDDYSRQKLLQRSFIYKIECKIILLIIEGMYGSTRNLNSFISFDNILVFDFGAARVIPDKAYILFSKELYKKGLLSDINLVLIANQRL